MPAKPPGTMDMIVYAVADIHGRSERLARMREVIREHRPDILVVAGDLMHRRDPEPVARCLAELDLPVLLVRGNTDPAALMAPVTALPNVTDLHLATVTRAGFRFTGIGGAIMLPLRSRIAWREQALLTAAAALMTPRTILVVHPPPRGSRDRILGGFHAGSSGVADLIRRQHPLVVICGHIHEAAGVKQQSGTTVVNCTMGAQGAGAVIRLASVTGPEVVFP